MSSIAFADTIEISATVPGCGDGVVSSEERCDGGNLNNASCQSLGFGSGTLSCTSACAFSITTCTFMPLGTSRSASASSRRDVGRDVVVPNTPSASIIDFDHDGKINLTDFSIIAYWYMRPSPPSFVDLSGDGNVNLIDFSIMAYYWSS